MLRLQTIVQFHDPPSQNYPKAKNYKIPKFEFHGPFDKTILCHWIFGQVETIEKWQIVDITQFHPKQTEFLKNGVSSCGSFYKRPKTIIIVLYYHKIQTFLHLDSFGTVGLGGWSLKLIFVFNVQHTTFATSTDENFIWPLLNLFIFLVLRYKAIGQRH